LWHSIRIVFSFLDVKNNNAEIRQRKEGSKQARMERRKEGKKKDSKREASCFRMFYATK
jgi:hypothetical protein